MPTYDPAPADVQDLAMEVMAKYHGDLVEAGVTIGTLFAKGTRAENGTKKSHAVKVGGYPCLAKVKVNSAEKRAEGLPDATITLDSDDDTGWPEWSEEERIAVLDHELEHLEILRDRDGQIKSDDRGRPKLRCKLHDWRCEGFAVIAKRHGSAAPEVQSALHFRDDYGQLLWEFAQPSLPFARPSQGKRASQQPQIGA